jgi:hypothetical protein
MSPVGPMGPIDEMTGEFERQARAVLEDSVLRIGGHVRSRLNQARHAAVAEASRGRSWSSFWRRYTFMPAAGAVAAAVLVTFVLWPHSRPGELPVTEGHPTTVEDLDLLADNDALDLVSDEADGGAFYEWAAEQADSNETST